MAPPQYTEEQQHPMTLNGTCSTDASNPPGEFWFDGIGIPVFSVTRLGIVSVWNRKLFEVTGLTAKDVNNRPLSDIIRHCNERESWERALSLCLLGKHDTTCCEIHLSCPCDPASLLRIKVTSQRNSNREIVGAVCFIEQSNDAPFFSSSRSRHDEDRIFTAPQQQQEQDRTTTEPPQSNHVDDYLCTRQELWHFLNKVLVPIFAADADGCIRKWNTKMTELTGYSHDEVLGTSLLLSDRFLAKEDSRDRIMDALLESSRGRECSVTVEFRHKDGSTLSLSMSTSALQQKDEYGATTVVCAMVVQDFTASCDHVIVSRELSQNLIETAIPIFSINSAGTVDFWNQKMTDISGFGPDDVLGKPLLDSFILPALRPSVQDILASAFLGRETSNYELEFRTNSGEVRYLLVNVTPRRNDQNEIVGALAVAQDVTDQAQHHHCVAAMARELRQLLDTADAPIFGVDRAGRINEWNDKSAEIFGYSGDEAFNKPFVEEFIAPHLQEYVSGVLDSAVKGRGITSYEMEIRTKSNEVRFLLVNATTRRDAGNNIVGAVCIAQDVTESSKHDRAVAAMASELRLLIDTANAPIFGIDCDGDVNEWNDKTSEITGYTKCEAFDCPLVETFIVPEMQDSVQNVLDDAIEGRGTSNFELEFRTKSNEIRHLLVNATTRRDAENNVVGVVGVAQDVTEAVQRDRAIAGMALELRTLIDTANAPIFGIDIDGNVNEWNRRTQEITGYSKEETFDEPLVERFIAPSMRQKVQEILDAALQGNETSNYELEFVAKSGEPRFMLVNATTRRDPEFNVVGVVGVAQDVTEDRKHAAELRKMQYLQATQEAKVETERKMTAYFAHELRNPLGAIDSALSAMPDDLPETAKTLVSGMQLCSSFMSSIMNNLLDVRKMEEGKMTLNSVPISLQALISGVHKMLLPSVKPGVAFNKVCDTDGRDWVLGDEHRIQQVMTNVVTNAIKYTVSGSITLSIGWEGDMVIFECNDTGPGIPKNEQAKLFQRFVQRGGAPGSGLGLAIAKHLVDLVGGFIRFNSDPTVKAGTSCVVAMPLKLCDPPEASAKKEDETAPLLQPLTFLIIDDVRMNKMMLKRRIKKGIAPNCIITEASTGEEALEICGKKDFDIILVDQYMEEAGGVMVGTDVVYAMRRMRIESLIIGCSGNDLEEEFSEAGADWVWQKPLPSNAEIIAQLRTFTRRKK